MVKIFGHPMSTCTRKVLMTCAENGIAHEMTLVDFAKGEHKAEPHLSRQPFGRIPAIDDEGFTMFESRAIARYLDQKSGNKLVPADAKVRAKVEQWISIETSEFSGHAMKYIYEYVFKRPQEPGVLDHAKKALETTLAFMDKTLAKQDYLTGSAFTLADICFMPYIDYAIGTPAKEIFAKYPNVMAWWGRISERPTWKKVSGKG